MMAIGNVGTTEFLVILVIALIFFGPRRLPGIANALGKGLREFRKALNEVKSEIAQADLTADVTKKIADVRRDIADLGGEITRVDTTAGPPPPSSAAETRAGASAAAQRPDQGEVETRGESGGKESESESETGADDGDPGDPNVPQN